MHKRPIVSRLHKNSPWTFIRNIKRASFTVSDVSTCSTTQSTVKDFGRLRIYKKNEQKTERLSEGGGRFCRLQQEYDTADVKKKKRNCDAGSRLAETNYKIRSTILLPYNDQKQTPLKEGHGLRPVAVGFSAR